jgi:class 3 adenylate cyclase
MFLDIIWFTSIAEKLSPNKVLLLLNIYFDGIVEIVKSNWWYIDKFLWDWMMVIFEDKRSDNIIKTAIEIQEFMNKFKISNIWKKINIWIWINSGDVIMWTVGSSERMEITIIWDVVNTASKIEWLTRLFGNKILISGNTYKLIQNKDLYNITNLWKQEIKWREHKIKLFWIES